MVTSRVWFTAEQKAELWARWKQGQSISSIPRALERRTKGGVQRIVVVHGGIAPPARRRAAWTLELGGARKDLSRDCIGFCYPRDCSKSGTVAINDKSGDRAQWRCASLSCNSC